MDILQETIIKSKIEDLQKASQKFTKQSNDLNDEGFKMHLEWIDKIWNFSITIIGVTVSIFLALKDKFSDTVCLDTFFWMWLSFLFSSIACFIARYCYSEVRFRQAHISRMFAKKLQLESINFVPPEFIVDSETGQNFDTSTVEKNNDSIKVYQDAIKKAQKKENSYLFYARSRFFAIGFFLLGMILLIVIGYDLIY
ncbi:hypothetical protein KA071_02015 [Candidatus Gracilibacteria bacterium]|nr:hypothetical protein [Candidatus Gracilibacteria bacterium]